MLKTCETESVNSTGAGDELRRSAPCPGPPRRLDEEVEQRPSDPVEWTSMKPPPPSPVSELSAANDVSTAATAASTALPPCRSAHGAGLGGGGMPAGDNSPVAHAAQLRRAFRPHLVTGV